MEIKTFILENTQNLDKISCHSHDPQVLDLLSKLKNKGITLNKMSYIISGPMGFQLHSYDYVPETYPERVKLIQISNIDEFGEIIDTPRNIYISKEKHFELEKSKVLKNDLVVGKVATINRIGLFKQDEEANLTTNTGVIRLKKEYNNIKIVQDYIHLFINSYYGEEQLLRIGGYRAGQCSLSIGEVGSIYVILPEEDKQIEILNKVKSIKEEIDKEYNEFQKYVHKLSNLLDDYTNLDLNNITNTWVIEPENITDRIDAYFHSQELKEIFKTINNLDKDKFDIVKVKKLDLIKAMNKKEIDENYNHLFKYVDIGNTEKDLGEIIGFEEDILLNLPSRAKMKAKENDILIPRPIGSTQGIVKVQNEFNNQLFTTGNIQIRPKDENESYLLWTMLKSNIIQKQFFYLQSGCSQPEISPNNFKKYVLFPFPKGKIREEIITKSKEYYNIALKHKKSFEDLKLHIKETFEKEINNLL